MINGPETCQIYTVLMLQKNASGFCKLETLSDRGT